MGDMISASGKCKTTGSPGPDGVTYQMIRNLPEAHAEELLEKINKAWEAGCLPSGRTILRDSPHSETWQNRQRLCET